MKKKLLIIFGVVLVVAGTCGSKYLLDRAEQTFLRKVHAAGLEMEYEGLSWRLHSFGAVFTDLRIYKKGDSLFSLTADKAGLYFGWPSTLRGEWSRISSLTLNGGSLELRDSLFQLDKADKKPKGWAILDIDVKDFTVSLPDAGTYFRIDGLTGSLQAKPQGQGNELRYSVVKRPIRLSLDEIRVDTLFKLHSMEMDTFMYDMKMGQMRLAGIRIDPVASKAAIEQSEPRIVLHANIRVPSIEIFGFEWSHRDEFYWHARKVLVKNPSYTAYQNFNKPLNEGHEQMPFVLIDSIETRFLVDSIAVVEGKLNFSISNDADTGRVQSDHWNILCLGFGNDSARPEFLNIQARMRWMENAWMEATARITYGDPNCNFFIRGRAGAMDFAVFNSILSPTEPYTFASGHCNGAQFTFSGNNYQSAGKLLIDFEDVALGSPDGEEQGLGKRLLFFGTNLIFIRTSTQGKSIEAEIGVKRDPRRGVPNFWINSLQSGLNDALMRTDMPGEKDSPSEKAEKKEEKKDNREEKKEDRQEKREKEKEMENEKKPKRERLGQN